MNDVSFVLVIKLIGLIGCLAGGFWQINRGFHLFQHGKSNPEKGHIKDFGSEFSLQSSGAIVMAFAAVWALVAVQFNPTFENGAGTKIASAEIQLKPFIISAPASETTSSTDPQAQKDIFETALKEAKKNNALIDLKANGRSVGYTLGRLNSTSIDTKEGTITLPIFIPALNTSRELRYLPIQVGNEIKFFPLDQSISKSSNPSKTQKIYGEEN